MQTASTFWYFNPALDGDGAKHVYSTAYTGGGSIPAGTYVGCEDLPASQADWNYTDEQFVFSNTTTTVPEPATLALLGSALVGLGLLRRDRKV